MIRLDRIVMREIVIPLKEPWVTAFGTLTARPVILLEARQGDLAGLGEACPLPHPYYTEETTQTAWHILEEFLIPLALSRAWSGPEEFAAAARVVRRNGMAKAGLEGALWDLAAKRKGLPLHRLLGSVRLEVPAGIAVGFAPSIDALVRHVGDALAAGYRRVKIKVKPGWDVEPVRALREAFGPFDLMIDANSAYTREDAARLEALDAFGLLMIEQPLDPDDLIGHAALQARLQTKICLDESLTSSLVVEQAIRLGSCRAVCLKVGRVGGLSEALAIHERCAREGVDLWCGGMLESGVGRAHNLALASLPGFTVPGDLSPSDRYWERDVVDPPLSMGAGGTLPLSGAPGIGVALDAEALTRYTLRERVFERPR